MVGQETSSGVPTWTGEIDEMNVWNIISAEDGADIIAKTYDAAIPEPSAFGLLAGISALALAVSRRKIPRMTQVARIEGNVSFVSKNVPVEKFAGTFFLKKRTQPLDTKSWHGVCRIRWHYE